jgi:uncharacterized protein (TIGR02246 family)
MSQAKQRTAALSGTAAEVEAEFYAALKSADIDKLMACWGHDEDILCIHPGGPRLLGPQAIRTAYESLFSQAGAINMVPTRVRVMESMGTAIHSVIERISVHTAEGAHDLHLIATNVYQKAAQGWCLVVHHVSPGSPGDGDGDDLGVAKVLH